MKGKKFLASVLTGTMVLSLTACGGTEQTSTTTDDTTVKETVEQQVETTPATTDTEVKEEVKTETTEKQPASIDFEDGNMGFVSLYTQPANADNSELSIVDHNGSKALYIKNIDAKTPYVAFDISSMLGSKVADVAKIEMTISTEYPTGGFSSCSGNIVSWYGADLAEAKDPWAVYLAKKNPNKAISEIKDNEKFVADAGNIIMLTVDTDNGVADGNGNASFYVDDIRFLDASGNLIDADSSVAFVAPAGFESSGKDLSNLAVVTGGVKVEGFEVKADAWAQAGVDMPQEVIDALVPGSVIEIEYKSETGNMWVVMPGATVGWSRVGDGNNGKAYINGSGNIAQITYEQIAAICGEDKSTWGTTLQCESDSAWEVYSVTVGQKSPVITCSNPVEVPDFAKKADAWCQDGVEMPQEVIDALVPGSVLEIDYTSESGNLWVVMPWATAGWMRVGDGNNGKSVCYNGKCYVTYEQIAEFCGEDKTTWGAMLQCESDSAWEVYGVRVGTKGEMKMVSGATNIDGFAKKADAWCQDGVELTPEQQALLVPGSVITVNYTSETGNMWIVMPWATAGWMRVGDGNNGKAACSNGVCQVTYEQIAEFCGDDPSTWGAMIQCESDSAWEVYGVSIGTAN